VRPSLKTAGQFALVNERKEVGVHEMNFDGSNLASEVYYCRLQAEDVEATKRLV
jgi:hypothetical protein